LHRGLRPDELRRRLEAGGRERDEETERAEELEVERPPVLSAGS
jgi:hypothetical protein